MLALRVSSLTPLGPNGVYTKGMKEAIATLAGGCFWCLEAVYQELPGITRITPGYIGGSLENPSYEDVCTGETGHAEALELAYDADKLDFETILGIFFAFHDPTTLNRQGADVGTQYRSAIFYHGEAQKEEAEQMIAKLAAEGVYQGIVTEVTPASTFYPAENDHLNYYRNHPYQPYCMAVIAPKVRKFRQHYAAKFSV